MKIICLYLAWTRERRAAEILFYFIFSVDGRDFDLILNLDYKTQQRSNANAKQGKSESNANANLDALTRNDHLSRRNIIEQQENKLE